MKKQNHLKNSLLFLSLILVACGQQTDSGKQTQKKQLDPFASTYKPMDSTATLFVNATILTGNGERLDNAVSILQITKLLS